MQSVVTAYNSCIILIVIGGVISAGLGHLDTMLSPLPVCSHDNNVCNIVIKNESSAVEEIEQVCTCAHGNVCPSTLSKTNTIRFLDSEWFVTCASLDTIPACEAGQASLFSQMENLDEPVNFVVKCTCPGGYDTNGALWRLDGTKVLVEIYCNDDQNMYEGPSDVYSDDNNFENEDQKDMKRSPDNSAFYKRSRDNSAFYKRSRDNSAFYKRGSSRDLYSFYKRGGSNLSGFYKRGLNSLQAIHQRSAFYKRAAESQAKATPSKRSVHYYKTFYKRAPYGNLNAFYKRDFPRDNSLDLEKKNYGLSSFYKRGYDNSANAFYKRSRFGISSFYKRAVANSADFTTRNTDEGLGTNDETSLVNENSLDGPVGLLYKPYTVLNRLPWHRNVGTSIDFDKDSVEDHRR